MKRVLLLLSFSLFLQTASFRATADVLPGQIDTYDEGNTLGWKHGMPNPDAPRVVPDGGPGGVGDAYLEVSSHGGFGAGGKLIMFNESRWTGSYGSESLVDRVVALEADFNNLGQEPLRLWINFDSPFGTVSTGGFELEPGSGWQHATFSLLPEDVTSSGDPLQILDNVDRVWLFHNADAPIHPAPEIEAVLGMDNLLAVGMDMPILSGDYNGNGQVEQADLDLVLLNWGSTLADPAAIGWINDLPSGAIDQEELDKVLLSWGNTAGGTTASVPEPASVMLLIMAVGLLLPRLRS